MKDYEKRIIAQYFHLSSGLLNEIRHHVYQTPDVPLPEALADRANIILSDYAEWIKDIKRVVGLESEQSTGGQA